MDLTVIILAAGKGTRMRSALPKVLHPLAGKPMVEHVVETAQQLDPDQIVVVYGHGGQVVPDRLAHLDVTWVEQKHQLGTGHAVQEAVATLDDASTVLVLYGDVPLIKTATLSSLLQPLADPAVGVSLLTATLDDPRGYGRIVRNAQHHVTKIVEHKDANESELTIHEVNTGILAARFDNLKGWLNRLNNDNVQQEYYLTDIIGMSVDDDLAVQTAGVSHVSEMLGVNNKRQLADLERQYQLQLAGELMDHGVTLADPARLDIRGQLSVSSDIFVDVNCVFEGQVHLGKNVYIGPHCVIKDSRIEDDAVIHAHSVLESATVHRDCSVGPFARLRPGTELHPRARIGNFVETKNASIGEASKVNHLSYVGDASIGKDVNIGAGTITCNYDGAFKHQTIIEDHVFVGSDTQLVAPVTIGQGATVGAGSTITKNVPPEKLALSRSKQMSIEGWQRPRKKKD